MDKVYKKAGKMVLISDKAPWHISGCRNILCRARHYCPVVYYRISVSESRRGDGTYSRAMNHFLRYADKNAHLVAVYEFIRVHKFDYNFKKFQKRNPPKGII